MVGLGEAAAGAICLLVSLNVLAAALVVAIARIGAEPAAADAAIQDTGIGVGWASLIVGVLLAIIGAILVKRGTSNMSNLTPERTVNQVSQDATLVKEQVR
jgi:hypothetical protein